MVTGVNGEVLSGYAGWLIVTVNDYYVTNGRSLCLCILCLMSRIVSACWCSSVFHETHQLRGRDVRVDEV